MTAMLEYRNKPPESKPLFRWLTPYEGAYKQSAIASARLGKWQRVWLAGAFAVSQSLALTLGFSLPQLEQPEQIPAAPDISKEQQLWDALGSVELAQATLAVSLQQAERDRLQAQQVRIEAEEKAQGLIAQAQKTAEQTTQAARADSEIIRKRASYAGAEQVIATSFGAAITLKFAARIECEAGEFGQTAVAYPLDSRIAVREVRNLSRCIASSQTPAGGAIGEAGDLGVAFFKRED